MRPSGISRLILRYALAAVFLLSGVSCSPALSVQSVPTVAPTPTIMEQTAATVENPNVDYYSAPSADSMPTAVAAATAIPPAGIDSPDSMSVPAAPKIENNRYAALRAALMEELVGLNGEWGIGLQNLSTGDTLLINADRQYPAASLYKLVLLYETFRQMEAGSIKLDQMTTMLESDYSDSLKWDEELQVGDRVSLKGLLRVLVIQSSNAAAHALERVMGNPSINAAAKGIGLDQTHMPDGQIRAKYNDWRAEQPATSVPDLMRFFGLVYRNELVSPAASKEMMALLKDQQINDRIPALLPPRVEVAHKTGNLPGVVADAGIIFGPRADVVIVVLNDGADHDEATAAIGKIARVVYDWHNR